MANELDAWPGGATWVFQGTVAEDATAGTHVCSLTVTPGAGNELQLLYGSIIDGNTATSQVPTAFIGDGSNVLVHLVNAELLGSTVLNLEMPIPGASQTAAIATTNVIDLATPSNALIVSGTMQLQLRVTTTQISVTQTFSVVCRIKGAVPTATLSDTVGTPVLTTNTSKVF